MSTRNHKRTMHVFYAAYGHGPWKCNFCTKHVHKIGKYTWDGNVHHLDGDKSNDDPDNLNITHTKCHQQHHAPTDELKAKISAKLTGRPSHTKGMKFSAETNARKG